MVSLEDLIAILSLLVATVAVVISMVNLIINITKKK